MFIVRGCDSIQGAMLKFLEVREHPKYEEVRIETVLKTEDFIHRRYCFRYKKDFFLTLLNFLPVSREMLCIQNDTYFDFQQEQITFVVEPSSKKHYRVEGTLVFEKKENEEVEVDVRIDDVLFKDSLRAVPGFMMPRVRGFITQQVLEDIGNMC
jgi:hypothetical protein